MNIGNYLYSEATAFVRKRYPTGWGGAAVLYTETEEIFISVAPEVLNASTELCMETGAICEAHKWNKIVTYSICVVRNDENSPFLVLAPCGVCQERLFYWGENVRAAVPCDSERKFAFKTLKELQHYYWYSSYKYLQADKSE